MDEQQDRRRGVPRWIWIAGGAAVLLVVIFAATFAATNQPSFCNRCHEMRPYYSAWRQSPHADVSCVRCHVDSSVSGQLAHKFVALGEVWNHFFNPQTFPRGHEKVPNERCTECHEKLPAKTAGGFEHALHLKKGVTCQRCHPTTGHRESFAALKADGSLAEGYPPTGSKQAFRISEDATVTLPGHKEVVCVKCHDLAKTPCSQCHTAPDDVDAHKVQREKKLACSQCHQPGAAFTFRHPDRTDCETCHTPPKTKPHEIEKPCLFCHKLRGTKWVFTHPVAASDCEECHNAPKNAAHTPSRTCTRCHPRVGVQWSFSHPSARTDCTECHKPPSRHFMDRCPQCHRTGESWAFVHPARNDCAACHKPPSRHYTSSCTSCHSTRVPFSRAVFRHPGNTGEHSFRSFACAKCHPSGFSTSSCTCHGGRAPVDD